jgi:hypothetical protein
LGAAFTGFAGAFAATCGAALGAAFTGFAGALAAGFTAAFTGFAGALVATFGDALTTFVGALAATFGTALATGLGVVFFAGADLVIAVVSFAGLFLTGFTGVCDAPEFSSRRNNDCFLAGSLPLALSFPT